MTKLTKKQKAVDRRPREALRRRRGDRRSPRPTPPSKFDETVEVALNLGVDPRHADQMVRGVVTLPKGTGKNVRVGVFARGAKADEATRSRRRRRRRRGPDGDVQGGKIDFDRCIATPDMMGVVGRLGKVLGPKGLMPNPKLGTVTMNVAAGGQGRQGRPGRIPRRKGRHHPFGHRQGQSSRPKTCAPTSTRWSTRSSRPSRRAPRASTSRRSR